MSRRSWRIEPSRRGVLIGGSAALAALPAASTGRSSAGAFQTARGRVFEDQRGEGRRQNGDRGLPGVLVSNGRDVVITDEDGRWSLPVRPGDHAFVVKPPNWSTHPARSGSSFSYLHQPQGSSRALHFEGVAPTGQLPKQIDFPLRRTAEDKKFNVALIADTQPSNLAELGYLRHALLPLLRDEQVAFAINHGDVVGDDLSLFEGYLDLIGTTGFAWHHCPGNHDMNSDSPDGQHAFETWKRVFGPTHFAFQAGDATFIILNTVDYAGYSRPHDMAPYRGWIGPRQLAFVKNLLRHVPAHHLIAVSMHIPLASHEDPANISDTAGDASSLLEILRHRRHTVSFAGHLHTTEHHYFGAEFGFPANQPHHHQVLTAACGSWWSGPLDLSGVPVADSRDGSPKGFHILSIEGNQYETRFVDASRSQMRVLITAPEAIGSQIPACGNILASQLTRSAAAHAQIVVDVFDGGPNTRVSLEVDHGAFTAIQLTRMAIPDPYIVESFSDPAISRPSWLRACPSSHIWVGSLPVSLAPGKHMLTVRAVGEFRREHTSAMEIIIV